MVKLFMKKRNCIAHKTQLGSVIDGISENIWTPLANIYYNLYNSVDDHDVQKLYKKINDVINSLRLHDVLKVAPL